MDKDVHQPSQSGSDRAQGEVPHPGAEVFPPGLEGTPVGDVLNYVMDEVAKVREAQQHIDAAAVIMGQAAAGNSGGWPVPQPKRRRRVPAGWRVIKGGAGALAPVGWVLRTRAHRVVAAAVAMTAAGAVGVTAPDLAAPAPAATYPAHHAAARGHPPRHQAPAGAPAPSAPLPSATPARRHHADHDPAPSPAGTPAPSVLPSPAPSVTVPPPSPVPSVTPTCVLAGQSGHCRDG